MFAQRPPPPDGAGALHPPVECQWSLQVRRAGANTILHTWRCTMDPVDLNVPPDDGDPDEHDHGRKSGPVEVVFRNHRRRLLSLFEEAREEDLACMGAVAWLTDPFVLRAMATVPTAIVTQKEDYLRPDGPGAGTRSWQAGLRKLYDAIADSGRWAADWPVPLERLYMPPPLCGMNYGEDHPMAGVRCCGIRNNRDAKARVYSPLMHNKFLIFARAVDQTGRGSE